MIYIKNFELLNENLYHNITDNEFYRIIDTSVEFSNYVIDYLVKMGFVKCKNTGQNKYTYYHHNIKKITINCLPDDYYIVEYDYMDLYKCDGFDGLKECMDQLDIE